MADISFASTSLSFQILAGCVKGFVVVSEARNIGRNASLLRTMLNFEEYRFIQWGKRAGIIGQGVSVDSQLNQTVATELMAQLEQLLTVDGLRKRYKLDLLDKRPQASGSNTINDAGEGPSASTALSAAVSQETRTEILVRAGILQSENHILKKLWWGAVDHRKFEILLQDIKQLIDGLERLLDTVQRKESMDVLNNLLVRVVQISNDTESLRALQSTLEATSLRSLLVSLSGIAAGLKATRIQIEPQGHVSQTAGTSNSADNDSLAQLTQSLTLARSNLVPADLDYRNLKDVRMEDETGSRGVGRYSNAAVYVELKEVPTKLKGPLRRRVEDLVAILSQPSNAAFRTLRCKGFFEDPQGFRLVYDYPEQVSSASGNVPAPKSLLGMFQEHRYPSVGSRIRLASAICRTMLTFQTAGWFHKDFRSENILFFPSVASTAYDIGQPFLCGFAFSREGSLREISEQPLADAKRDIYRHPGALKDNDSRFEGHMDLYSLGLVLIEIAEWRRLSRIIKDYIPLEAYDSSAGVPLNKIVGLGQVLYTRFIGQGEAAFRLGERFATVVRLCLQRTAQTDAAPPALEALQTATGELENSSV